MTPFDQGQARYEEQPHDGWQCLKNAQLYPTEFVAGYEHAQELHQERYNDAGGAR